MTAPVTTCYRHPDRRAGVSCQRCDRPICANCMIQASVGFQCPECVKGAKQQVYNTSNIHTLGRPWVTFALIAVNVGVFCVDAALTAMQSKGWCQAVPASMRPTVLQYFGALTSETGYCSSTLGGVGHGEYWRIVTSGFLHFGPLHLLLNMVALYMVGTQLERALGRGRYFALYFISLLSGSLAVVTLSSGGGLAAGASGAIFGLFGVAFVYQRSLGIDPWRSGLAGIIGINLVFTFAWSGISWQAHIGGLIGGAVAALAVFWIEKQVKSTAVMYLFCAGVALCLFVGSVFASTALPTRF